MITWETITLEESETERTKCDCCQSETVSITGDLLNGDSFLGWFNVRFASNLSEHPPIISVYVGDWSEDAPTEARWGMRVRWHEGGCELLDWSNDDKAGIARFVALGRNEMLGSAYETEFWAMIDAIIMKDSRLEELRSDP